MNRSFLLIFALTLAGLLAGKIVVQGSTQELDSTLAYSCGYLARLESSDSTRDQVTSESYFCRKYRLTAIAHGFSVARDAYPEEPKP